MINALRERGPGASVADAMHTDVRRVPAGNTLEEAYRLMTESDCPAVLATDATGRIVGILTAENVGELMMVQSAVARNAGKSTRPS
jgi:predicted transcriptional regulator